jgi:large subunit ribosomal protein L22
MAILVKHRRAGISPMKVRLVCDLISGKKEIAVTLAKLINSGLAIAAESGKYDMDNLVINTLFANDGPTLKRIQPRAQGRAYRIRKRTSNITLELKEE